MAATDGRPIPQKGVAYRLYFPIWKTDGTLITGAAGADSERSIDGGTFADLSSTDEIHEVATSSGVYYVDLDSTDMNGDCIVYKCTVTDTGAIPVIITLYPQEAGDIRTNVTYWNGTAVATPTTAGVPEVDVTYWNGSATPVTNLGDSALGIIRCNAQGTHSNTSTVSDSSISSVDDFYNGRTMVFVSGSLAGQAARITDYTGSTKTFTHTALANSASASNGDDFVVV